ncbi:MAG: hypothetical protein AB7S77_23195, partial [Desulfatirhabdiaceae bacterium]
RRGHALPEKYVALRQMEQYGKEPVQTKPERHITLPLNGIAPKQGGSFNSLIIYGKMNSV